MKPPKNNIVSKFPALPILSSLQIQLRPGTESRRAQHSLAGTVWISKWPPEGKPKCRERSL